SSSGGKLILGQRRLKNAGTDRSSGVPPSFLASTSVMQETSIFPSVPSPRVRTTTVVGWTDALRKRSRKARSSPRKTTTCHSRPFLSMMALRPSRPDSHMSRSASMAIAMRASLGRVPNQSVKTSTGVLVGMPASRELLQLWCTVCRHQLNVQRAREMADFQHMETNDGAVFIHLFHDLIMSSFAEVAFLLLKHDFEKVTLAIVPDCYVVFCGHN